MKVAEVGIGDVVSFTYNGGEHSGKRRLVYVEHVDNNTLGGWDYTVDGYRNFSVRNVCTDFFTHGFASVGKEDVKVEELSLDDVLAENLGVVSDYENKVHPAVFAALDLVLVNSKSGYEAFERIGDKVYKMTFDVLSDEELVKKVLNKIEEVKQDLVERYGLKSE